jgi:hypothetical protein
MACFFSISVLAADNNINETGLKKVDIKDLVQNFYQKKINLNWKTSAPSELQNGHSGQCDDASLGKGSCIDVVCSKLPKFLCDEDHELKEVAMMCANNRGGSCVEAVCQHLPRYQCDDVSELKQIAQSCSGLMDVSCMDSVCAHLPKYKCDDLNEIKDILNSCKNP